MAVTTAASSTRLNWKRRSQGPWRGRRIHLRTRQRSHTRRGRSAARISAVHRGDLPPPRRAPHRRRSHDRHGPHRPQLRGRHIPSVCARYSGHRQRTLQRIRAARRSHRQQESGRRDRRWLVARSCTASPTTRIPFRSPPDAPCCVHLQMQNLVEAADSSRPGTAAAQTSSKALESSANGGSVGDVRGIRPALGRGIRRRQSQTKRRSPPTRTLRGRVAAAAMKRGVLVYPMQGSVDGISGDHLLLAPPAIITPEQITWAVEQLRAAVRKRSLRSELWAQ